MNKDNKEIERRFLLRKLPAKKYLRKKTSDCRRYKTIYLWSGDPELRIRKSVFCSGQEKGKATFSLTIKFGEGLERYEFINEISGMFFEEYSMRRRGLTLEKIRYRIKDGDVTWELDEINHLGRLFFLAEIELKNSLQPVTFPKWLKKLVLKEVTNDPRYYNKNIASTGFPEII